MMLTSGTSDMTVSVSGDIVYVTSKPNTVSIVPIDPSGTLSPPFIAPPLPGPVILDAFTIVAAAPAVYARGGNQFCGYSVQAGGLLAAPICVAQAQPSTRGSLLVAGNVLYSLILDSVHPRLQAFFIAPTNGDLQWVDADPVSIAFNDLELGGYPSTMAASPDGSVVYAAYQGGIASVTAPTATHPHSILSSSSRVVSAAALAVDPAGNVLYATDPTQGLVFSIPVSNGAFLSQPPLSSVPLGAYPGSIAAAPYTARQPPHWPP